MNRILVIVNCSKNVCGYKYFIFLNYTVNFTDEQENVTLFTSVLIPQILKISFVIFIIYYNHIFLKMFNRYFASLEASIICGEVISLGTAYNNALLFYNEIKIKN